MTRKAAAVLIALVFSIGLGGSFARAQALSGKEVAQRAHDRPVGKDSVAQMEMILESKSGHRRVRTFRAVTRTDGPLRKALIRFLSPADIEGTGFLVLEREGAETEQFLFLPALRRARRIVSSQKGRSFVNSDFTYEDMERRPVGDFDHTLVGEEVLEQVPCWVVDSTPKPGTRSQYGRLRTWVAKDMDVPLRIHYFDKKDRHIKTYQVQALQQIEGIWTEMVVVMHNLKDDHRTILRTLDVDYDTGLDDSAFTVRALETW